MGKNLQTLRINAMVQKIVNLTGKNCMKFQALLMRSDIDTVQEIHGIIVNLEEQIMILKRKLKSEQIKNKF